MKKELFMENEKPQIRWKQRFENYKKALSNLETGLEIASEKELNILEKQGLLKSFEFTFELSWKVMKDYLSEQGIQGIIGSRGAFRNAYENGLISEGQTWLDMIEDRNVISHDYDEEAAETVISKIEAYSVLFRNFSDTMQKISEKD